MFIFAIPYVLGILIFLPKDYQSTKIQTMDISTIENCMNHSEMSDNSENSQISKNFEIPKGSKNSINPKDSKNSKIPKDSKNSDFKNTKNHQTPTVFKSKKLYLCSGIILFYQFAGCNVITKYASTILQSEGNQLSTIFGQFDPALVNSTFVGMAGLIGVILGIIFVHNGFQRRSLLLNSAMGTSVAFLTLGFINSEIVLTDGDT